MTDELLRLEQLLERERPNYLEELLHWKRVRKLLILRKVARWLRAPEHLPGTDHEVFTPPEIRRAIRDAMKAPWVDFIRMVRNPLRPSSSWAQGPNGIPPIIRVTVQVPDCESGIADVHVTVSPLLLETRPVLAAYELLTDFRVEAGKSWYPPPRRRERAEEAPSPVPENHIEVADLIRNVQPWGHSPRFYITVVEEPTMYRFYTRAESNYLGGLAKTHLNHGTLTTEDLAAAAELLNWRQVMVEIREFDGEYSGFVISALR
jgi:hypothetical protein